jgi:hypothetical protein
VVSGFFCQVHIPQKIVPTVEEDPIYITYKKITVDFNSVGLCKHLDPV